MSMVSPHSASHIVINPISLLSGTWPIESNTQTHNHAHTHTHTQ